MKNKEGKSTRLSTYAAVMLLTAIIVIIVAAMADNRERAQTDSASRTIQAIQDDFAQLQNENFELSQEVERLNSEAEARTAIDEVYTKLAEVWRLYNEEKVEEAAQLLSEIDESALTEPQADIYAAIKTATAKKDEK